MAAAPQSPAPRPLTPVSRVLRLCLHALLFGLLALAAGRAVTDRAAGRLGRRRLRGAGRRLRGRRTGSRGAPLTARRGGVAGRSGRGLGGAAGGLPRRAVDRVPAVLPGAAPVAASLGRDGRRGDRVRGDRRLPGAQQHGDARSLPRAAARRGRRGGDRTGLPGAVPRERTPPRADRGAHRHPGRAGRGRAERRHPGRAGTAGAGDPRHAGAGAVLDPAAAPGGGAVAGRAGPGAAPGRAHRPGHRDGAAAERRGAARVRGRRRGRRRGRLGRSGSRRPPRGSAGAYRRGPGGRPGEPRRGTSLRTGAHPAGPGARVPRRCAGAAVHGGSGASRPLLPERRAPRPAHPVRGRAAADRAVGAGQRGAARGGRARRDHPDLHGRLGDARHRGRRERLRSVLGPSGEGGFGLPAMRSRAETLGGLFTVESAPGQGTAVAVTLPLPLEAP